MNPSVVHLGILAVIALVLLFASHTAVPKGQNWTVERFGRYQRTLVPGSHWILPFIDRIGMKVMMVEIIEEIERVRATSRDRYVLEIDMRVAFQVVDAISAAYRTANIERSLRLAIEEAIKGEANKVDYASARSDFHGFAERIKAATKPQCDEWGIAINRLVVTELLPIETSPTSAKSAGDAR